MPASIYMLSRTVFALSIATLLTCITTTYSQEFQSNVSCDETVFNTIYQDDIHVFRLTTNNTYNVKFHSCRSNTDIAVAFFDHLDNFVSNEACPAQDGCGVCKNTNNDAEKFTMNALEAGSYTIVITSYGDGDYEFEVNCDESSTLNLLCPHCKGRLDCGDDKNAISRTQEGDYYYFNLSNDSAVSFLSCGSSFDTVLTLYDMELSPLYEADDDGHCQIDVHAVLALEELLAGEYVLRIGGYTESSRRFGAYSLRVMCIPVITEHITYKLLTNPLQNGQWSSSEIHCRDTYGTSLATVITDEDIFDVRYEVWHIELTTPYILH